MNERPIIFSGEMVRAILDGRKTQTRRVIKPQPECEIPRAYFDAYNRGPQWNWWTQDDLLCNAHTIVECPYGVPGDRLWVRETWKYWDWSNDGDPKIKYRADGALLFRTRIPEEWSEKLSDIWADLSTPDNFNIEHAARDQSWRSPIYMPRWASYITLEITDIRVERVQSITPADVMAEGVTAEQHCEGMGNPCDEMRLINEFELLWNSINEKRGYGWDTNPWVWVVDFERIL